MAMKSSGRALHWKPHPSPSERHGALRQKQKQFLIDYDNHHLNQVPAALSLSLSFSLHCCTPASLLHLSHSHLFHLTPGYSAFLAEHRSKPPAKPPSPLHPPPPSSPLITHTHVHAHKNVRDAHTNSTLSISQTHKTTLIATCI